MKKIYYALFVYYLFVPINYVHSAYPLPEPSPALKENITALAIKYDVVEEIPTITKIIMCESSFKPEAVHVNANGTRDWSYFQFNDRYWENDLKRIGFDIYNPEDNLEAGFYIISKQGNRIWSASNTCWHDA